MTEADGGEVEDDEEGVVVDDLRARGVCLVATTTTPRCFYATTRVLEHLALVYSTQHVRNHVLWTGTGRAPEPVHRQGGGRGPHGAGRCYGTVASCI